MTRLTADDIRDIVMHLPDYDSALFEKTGCSLRGIACHAVGVKETDIQHKLSDISVGIIPITSGQGVISGFCAAVAGIVAHIGADAFVTRLTDAAGVVEAFEKKADIIMLADDVRFVAIHAHSRRVIDNAAATGKGFGAGLDLMAAGVKQKEVLVIGCGPVGCAAAEALVGWGACVAVHDLRQQRCRELVQRINQARNCTLKIEKEFDAALARYRLVVDATPAAAIIRPRHIAPATYISAPGVPLGLDPEARHLLSGRLLHDPLQIGVATMAVWALKFQHSPI